MLGCPVGFANRIDLLVRQGFMLQKSLGQCRMRFVIVVQPFINHLMRGLGKGSDFQVNDALRVRGVAGALAHAATQKHVLLLTGVTRRPQLRVITPLGDHVTDNVGRLLNVVAGPGGDVFLAEDQFFRDAAAEGHGQLRFQLNLRLAEHVAFRQGHGHAQGPATGDDGHLVDRVVLGHHDADDGVTGFVIGGQLLFFLGHDHGTALGTHQDLVLGAFEIVQKLDEAQAQTMATVGKAGGIALFGTILCAVILATGIRRIVSKPLKMMVDSLTQGSLQVRDASGELASAAQSLASSTSQQSASLEETASALNQVEAMITQNAASTKEADTIMQSSVRSMHDGAEKVSAMSGAMTEMTESSSQIRDIIKLIQDIAFQTNLLALNAAVEAARAGDAGRGFAVVAEEVRSLAQRSSEAARRTTDLVENSVRTISNGSTILDELKSSFNDAEQHLKRIAEHMGQISRASTEQSQGINQVTQSMNHIDALNQSNASASEEAASASEELASQSALLMDLIAELRSWGEQSSNTSGNHGDNGFLEQYDHPKAPLAARPGKSDSTPDPESVLPF